MSVVISQLFVKALSFSNLVTLAVFAMPDLITLGFLAFISPGFILELTPTVFLYLAAFSVPRT